MLTKTYFIFYCGMEQQLCDKSETFTIIYKALPLQIIGME